MRIRWDKDGSNVWAEPNDPDKIGWIGDRIAYVRSGSFEVRAEGMRVDARSSALGDLASGVFAALLDRRVVTPQVEELQGIELIIGGGPSGAAPQLLWLRSDPERVE